MFEGSKSFPPSDLKLERLRKEGVVPFSLELQNAALIAALVAGGWLFYASAWNWFGIADFVREYLSSDGAKADELVLRAQGLFFELSAVVLFPLLLAVVLVGLCQTRFLIVSRPFKIGFSWMLKLSNPLSGTFVRLIARLMELLKCSCWVLICSLCLFWCFGLLFDRTGSETAAAEKSNGSAVFMELVLSGNLKAAKSAETKGPGPAFGLGQLERDIFRARLKETFWPFLVAALAYAAILGVLSRIWCVLKFQREHSMTREEIEAEQREVETPGIVKDARKDFLLSEIDGGEE